MGHKKTPGETTGRTSVKALLLPLSPRAGEGHGDGGLRLCTGTFRKATAFTPALCRSREKAQEQGLGQLAHRLFKQCPGFVAEAAFPFTVETGFA